MGNDPSQKDPSKGPAGRVTFDQQGNAVWQPFTEVNTDQTLNVLLRIDELSVDDAGGAGVSLTGFDPYGGAPERKEKRRTIDDMRKLSEQIKNERLKKADGG